MGITSLFHLIVFTHHITSFQSSEMSVVLRRTREKVVVGGRAKRVPSCGGHPVSPGWVLSASPSGLGAVMSLCHGSLVPMGLWRAVDFGGPVTGPQHPRFFFSSHELAYEET